MTRARKVDPAVLEREYVYDAGQPPISITSLADKYGLARSGVADKARIGNWYEKRQEFRRTVGEKVIDAMGDEWARVAVAHRELSIHTSMQVIQKFVERLESGDYKPTAKDALAAMAALRQFDIDAAQNAHNEAKVITPEEIELGPDQMREVHDNVKRLLAGTEEAE